MQFGIFRTACSEQSSCISYFVYLAWNRNFSSNHILTPSDFIHTTNHKWDLRFMFYIACLLSSCSFCCFLYFLPLNFTSLFMVDAILWLISYSSLFWMSFARFLLVFHHFSRTSNKIHLCFGRNNTLIGILQYIFYLTDWSCVEKLPDKLGSGIKSIFLCSNKEKIYRKQTYPLGGFICCLLSYKVNIYFHFSLNPETLFLGGGGGV